MPGPPDSVAASSMPLGRMQGGSHVSFAGVSEQLLQHSAASDAASVATQDDVQVPPSRIAAVQAPQCNGSVDYVTRRNARPQVACEHVRREWSAAVAQCYTKRRGSGQEPGAKTRQCEKAGLTLIRHPSSGVQGGGSHVSSLAGVLRR